MTTLFVLEVKGLGDREEEFTFCGVFSQQALAEAYVRDMRMKRRTTNQTI